LCYVENMHAPQPAPVPAPDRRRWWRFHEAGYSVAAKTLGVAITPSSRERPLRSFVGDLKWPVTAETDAALLAVVALAGGAALHRVGGTGDRDTLLAGDLIFEFEIAARYGMSRTPAFCRVHMTARLAELADQAHQLVEAHWSEIEAEARLLTTSRH
jgi:hypothetical protein